MTTARKSHLNPLANAFIPTINQIGSLKKPVQLSSKNRKTGNRRKNLNFSESETNSKDMATALDIRKTSVWNDIFFFGSLSSMLNVFLNSKLNGKKSAFTIEESQLSVLQECPKADQELAKISNIDLIKITKAVEVECNCPAMFGWILPPEFIWNPFNLKFECNKKYPHSSNSIEKESNIDKLDSYDKINDLTLDECYSEIKNILIDVHTIISMDSNVAPKCDKKREMDSLDVSDGEMRKEECLHSKRFSSNPASGVTTRHELVDDGCHPLLQSETFTRDEGEKELVEKVEKILEKSLNSSLPDSLDSLSVCDPPCSVWCDFLPLAAKDSFKKFIQKSANCNKACHNLSYGHRPLYKRSFSADDAPMLGRFNQSLVPTAPVDSREMLLLRRKDPLNYFKIRSPSIINGNKFGSLDLKSHKLLPDFNEDKSGKWGKFDSSDSLWKPLPDCMPINFYQQQNCHKRGREARRERMEN